MKIEIDLSGLEERFSQANIDAAHLALTERVGTDSNLHAPEDTGGLKGSKKIEGKDTVTWPVNYAVYPYYGYGTIHKNKNPLAEPAWFEFAKSSYLPDWEQTVRSML